MVMGWQGQQQNRETQWGRKSKASLLPLRLAVQHGGVETQAFLRSYEIQDPAFLKALW